MNSAGMAALRPKDEMPPEEWRRIIEVNLLGVYYVTRAVWPHMKARGSGSIIMISSGSGRRAHAGWSAYCASKFAVMGLADSLAKEGRPFGIRCNVICPGATDTDQRRANFPGEDTSKLLRPEDVAKAIKDWARHMPDEAKGLLTARTLTPEEELELEEPEAA